jgi:hypothetical protein
METVLACESIGTKHKTVMAQFHNNYVWPIPIQLKFKHWKNCMCTNPSVYAYLRKNKKIKVTNEKEINK